MKYGLVTFKKTRNIGDDIQSYAAIRYLPQIDYYIEREELNEFVPKKNELVTVIMNGWYNHSKYSFPPSPFIHPLFVSIHFTDELKDEKPVYFNQYFLDYLRKYEPIGVRDALIKPYLDEANIESQFSGCLTLTIEKFKDVKKKDVVCVVDIDDELVEILEKDPKINIVKRTHRLSEDNEQLSWSKRMQNVETLLKDYQSSRCVITSRLHCALPCLALNVPVLLVYDDKNKDVKNRLGEYTKMLNCVTKAEFKSKVKKYIHDLPDNPQQYKKYRNALIKQATNFIEKSKEMKLDVKDDIQYYQKYFVEPTKSLLEIASKREKTLNELAEERYRLLKEQEKRNQKLELITEGLTKENNYMKQNVKVLYENNQILYKIQNSKDYRACQFIRRVLSKIKNTFKIKKNY